MAKKIILPGAWELTQADEIKLYQLTVPTEWRQRVRYLAGEKARLRGGYPSIPVSSLDPIVSASFPQIIKTVRYGWQRPEIPWLYALEQVDLSCLPELIKDWLLEEYVWCLGGETVDNVLNRLGNSQWQWDNATIDLSLLEPPAANNIDFRFQAVPDYIAKRFLEQDNTIIFQGENAEHELKFYPVVRLNQGAELMSYPPYEIPLIENKEQKGRVFISFVIKFTLQTVPRRKQPLIYHHLSVRRWVVEPFEKLPYKGMTVFFGDNHRWLDGTHQPFSLVPLKITKQGKEEPEQWHRAISRLMNLNDSPLPNADFFKTEPKHNWSNWDEQSEEIQIAIPYSNKHKKLPGRPEVGVSPRDLASLDAAIVEQINNGLPLKRVAEAEEIPNKYFSYWGKKEPNNDDDSATPMHRPSLAAPAVFAKRKISLKTILIVWETKQCRDELIKEICTRLYLTPATETQIYTTASGGEVKETIYTGEYGSICLKTMHVADLTQNFDIALRDKQYIKQRKRENFMAERIERIRTYLPLTKELCGAIIEIKSLPKYDKPSKPPEADPKKAWRIGAAQANYLNQHINSISARNKKTREEFIVRGGLNRVKSAVSDLFRQFAILPTSTKLLIDPEKDNIGLHTWLTCFYVLRRTRQTSESNSASRVVLMLRVNPVNGEVQITTPDWFKDESKVWVSYPLAEQLLLNERWEPDSLIDEFDPELEGEQTSTRKEREQRLADQFVSNCLQDCLNTPIEKEQFPHVLFMAEAQNARKLLKWLQNPYVPKTHDVLPRQLNRQLSEGEKKRLFIVRFRETKQNETPVAVWRRKPAGRPSGIFQWKDVSDDSKQNLYLSIRNPLNTEKGTSILGVSQSRLDNGRRKAANKRPIEIVVVYSSTIEQDTLAKFVHNLRDRNPYYSNFNTLPFPFSLAIPTKEYAIGVRDRVELEESGEEE